jgi:hypothetical protein
MFPGKHNVSLTTAFRLAECQSEGSRLGSDEDRRRFWAKVRVLDSDNACWLWAAGKTSNGRYGQFLWAARYGRTTPVGAHRAAWELEAGPIGDGQQILHSCDTPLCVNPSHLFLGTATDNMQDASRKGRLNRPRPTRQKISDERVVEMLTRYQAGESGADLAAEYGINKTLISQLVNGHRRHWLNPEQFNRTGRARRKAVA